MIDKSIFCGCSYVEGVGLDLKSQDPSLWVNQVYQSIDWLKSTTLINLGEGGATNEDIFCRSLESLYDDSCRNLFVCWTSTKRIRLNPSVELYETELYLENSKIPDVHINPRMVIPGKYVEDIRDRFFLLNHEHYEILKILRYSWLLAGAAKITKTKIYFVNCLLQIDQDYFVHISDKNRLPSDTTPFTQKILNAETRDDDEYFQVYDRVHQDYAQSRALDLDWINLDQGYRRKFMCDYAKDGLHPGIESNRIFAKFVAEKLQQIKPDNNYV